MKKTLKSRLPAFKVGQRVWFASGAFALRGKVVCVTLNQGSFPGSNYIYYITCEENDSSLTMPDDVVFKTEKEALEFQISSLETILSYNKEKLKNLK